MADVDDLIKRVRTAMEEELLSLTNTIPDRHRPAATDEDAVAWAGQKAGETVTADGRAMATSRKGKL